MKTLIVGLGNPGSSYVGTRHNIGFEVANAIAEKQSIDFREKARFKGLVAESGSLVVLKPTTYMNLSGESVVASADFYKISSSHIFVIVDDVDLPFGQVRLKINSGPGTHNGLKSIENSLKTNRYPRLKIGVGNRAQGSLADYVLSRFSVEEQKEIPQIIENAVEAIEVWLKLGITRAMEFTNRKKPSNPSKENNE